MHVCTVASRSVRRNNNHAVCSVCTADKLDTEYIPVGNNMYACMCVCVCMLAEGSVWLAQQEADLKTHPK